MKLPGSYSGAGFKFSGDFVPIGGRYQVAAVSTYQQSHISLLDVQSVTVLSKCCKLKVINTMAARFVVTGAGIALSLERPGLKQGTLSKKIKLATMSHSGLS